MRKLLILYLIGLSMAHFGVLGVLRYAVVAAAITAIVAMEGKFFFSRSIVYNLGGLLFMGGGVIAYVTNGTTFSLTYILFILINFMLYPGFEKYSIPRRFIQLFTLYLVFTLTYVTDFGALKGGNLYGNGNNYATVVICTSYFALLSFRGSFLKQLLTTPIFVTLVFLSQSRTQLAAILLFYGLYFTQEYLLRLHFRRLIFFLVIGMFVLYGTLISGDPLDIISVVQENTYGHKSYRGLSYRDVLFFASVDILASYPLGVGWGLSGEYIYDYIGDRLSPHNTFMKVAVEGGWVALSGFLVLLLGRLWTTTSPLVSSFMVALTLRGLFESSTPFTLSFVSSMLLLPFFLNDRTIDQPYTVQPAPPRPGDRSTSYAQIS